MSRPLIGITSYRDPASWGRWNAVDATLLPAAYTDAVRDGGGTVVLIPPLGAGDDPADVVRRLDALVIAGGADVNPSRYGDEPGPATISWRDDRDVSELALLTAADDLSMPVLGICRGMQVMAVAAGGSLLQHVPDATGTSRHCPGPDSYGPIQVQMTPGSRLEAILGPTITAACHHHQAVAAHPGMDAVATADDGLLEAIETPGPRFRIGVQWHPETQPDRRLFQALIAAALDRGVPVGGRSAGRSGPG